MKTVYFKDQYEFRQWLEENHADKKELLVGFYKISTGKPSMTWSESVDQAICFGWIDGIRKTVNNESYCIRFTPRKPTSTWSKVNINKAETLIKNKLMTALPCVPKLPHKPCALAAWAPLKAADSTR